MSKVTDVLEKTPNNTKALVFYDGNSIDSVFGAGIIKYICENITNISDNCECIDIKEIDNIDLYISDDNGELIQNYMNLSFIGCLPSDKEILKLSSIYSTSCLFVTCNKFKYLKLKSLAKNISIEYNINNSCALNLYKIAFGEFEDKIPNIIKIISDGTLKNFGESYNNYIAFEIGFNKYFESFDDFYNLLYNLVEGIPSEDDPMTKFDKMISSGKTTLANDNKYLLRNIDLIKSDIWKVNKQNNCLCIFTQGPVSENIVNELTDYNKLIIFYREDSNYWNMELLNINPEDTSINCGLYCKTMYKGMGTPNHGSALIPNDTFSKLIFTKKL